MKAMELLMPLKFPEVEDVLLGKSPLTEVICQLRFDPILSIGILPAQFQERVRKKFPKYEVEAPITLDISDPDSDTGSRSVQLGPQAAKFISPNGKSVIALATNFVALTTAEYSSWDRFEPDVRLMIDSAMGVYGPLSVTRVGLRYVNIVKSDQVGLADRSELLDIINPALRSPIENDAWSEFEVYQSALVAHDGQNQLGLRFAAQDSEITLDLDYYREHDFNGEEDLSVLLALLDEFHDRIYQAFRWCISDERLELFQPQRGEAE